MYCEERLRGANLGGFNDVLVDYAAQPKETADFSRRKLLEISMDHGFTNDRFEEKLADAIHAGFLELSGANRVQFSIPSMQTFMACGGDHDETVCQLREAYKLSETGN